MTERSSRLSGLLRLYFGLGDFLQKWIGPLFLLGMRFWLARIFFKSGYGRAKDWGSQSFMFESIHPVPGIPPNLAAYITTGAELVLPVMLMIGLFSRIAAFGMLIMTVVIQFIVAATPQGIENKIANSEHYYWMFLALMIICFGPGKLSIDALLRRRIGAKQAS